MRQWLKRAWLKTKAWFLGVLVALGLVTAAVQAATVDFTYTPATTYSDGTLMPLTDIDETRLYCNGTLVATEAGADGDFSIVLGFGTYDCYATHVVNAAQIPESLASNQVTKVVSPTQPSAPTLD